MSETRIGCPMRRCGGQRSGQNHDASARTATRAETPGRVGWRRAWASPSLANMPSVQVCRVRECVLPSRAVKPGRCNGLVLSLPGSLPKTGV